MNDASQLSFGRRLRRLRTQHDLTQEALAELANCSVQAVRFFETGKRRPSIEMAERLAEVLDVPEGERAEFVRQARVALQTAGDTPDAPDLPDAPSSAVVSVTRLPQPSTPLIGRQPEANVLRHLFLEEGARLVSLVGPGGIGKTRLALHMAHELAPHFSHGAIFVSLVGVFGASDIPIAVAAALRTSLAGDGAPADQLDSLLGGQAILLVLDNFEHLLAQEADYTTTLVDHIVRQHPGVRMLITSRERLRLGGERIFELGGLGLPALNPVDEGSANGGPVSDAVELFIQRVRQVAPGLQLSAEARPAILRICRLLRGMPLGIELAAAWARTLSPEEIEVEISRSLDFLMLSDRSAPPRHRSMRAVFEHSWQLLAPDEQRAAARLSVFHGGFRREAAQAVAGASLHHLASLIDKSLVITSGAADAHDPTRRYELHELLRQYLADKLAETDDPQQVKRRHAEAITIYMEEIEQRLYENQSVGSIRQIEAEQGNVRAALEWTLANGHDPVLGLRLAGAMGRYWYLGGGWKEACEWLRRALALTPEDCQPAGRARLCQTG